MTSIQSELLKDIQKEESLQKLIEDDGEIYSSEDNDKVDIIK